MPLLTFWESNKDAVLGMSIVQVVANAGDGTLRDAAPSSLELREFLRYVDASVLERYATHCLTQSFPNSGFVLQDVVNELGRRLGYKVSNGLYRGKVNAIGFDGVWQHPGSRQLVVEVKTTDYYNIDLSKVFAYREKLVATGDVAADSAVLFVVGRDDSNSLEAQIRGSRHAWDARLVSVDSLVKMVKVKESTDDQTTANRLRTLLEPLEYTRIDRLIDVVFETVADVQAASSAEETSVVVEVPMDAVQGTAPKGEAGATSREDIKAVRDQVVAALSKSLGTQLNKETRTAYESDDETTRVVVAVSKRYPHAAQAYWYAYHPYWQTFLEGTKNGLFVMACLDKQEAYAIPIEVLTPLLPKLNKTEKEDRSYWHIVLQDDSAGTALRLTRFGEVIPLTQYAIQL